MAIATNPRLLIADEPTTALDVTTQLEILSLLRRLQEETGMAMLLISHDVSVIGAMCQEALVMYCGQAVEVGKAGQVLASPRHPYTAALIRAAFCARHKGEELAAIGGVVASPEQRRGLTGCLFAPRCPLRARGECPSPDSPPPLRGLPGGRSFRCHLEGGAADG